MKTIIILGGSYAGVSAAHHLLKQSGKTVPFKVILVTPNSHLYWNIASPRALISDQIADDKLFQPIAPGFEQYPSEKFELILATAKELDVEAKTVKASGASGELTLNYDVLIIATGSSTKDDTPFKGLGSTEDTRRRLHDYQARVKEAKTIVVAGAGVTGAEVAGELGYEFGKQNEIILDRVGSSNNYQIARGKTVLESSPTSVANIATKELLNLGVKIELQETVATSTKLPDGRHELTLSSGKKLITDMYIPTFGLAPNTSFVPTKFLDATGAVVVDERLQVNGAGLVWVIGDASSTEGSQYMPCNRQSAHAAKNIILMLNGKPLVSYSPWAYAQSEEHAKTANELSSGETQYIQEWLAVAAYIDSHTDNPLLSIIMLLRELPPEILLHILRLLGSAFFQHDTRRLLVSKWWYQLAKPVLLRDLDFSAKSLRGFVLASKNTDLSRSVQRYSTSINLSVNGFENWEAARFGRVEIDLQVVDAWTSEFNTNLAALARIIQPSTSLRSLKVEAHREFHNPSSGLQQRHYLSALPLVSLVSVGHLTCLEIDTHGTDLRLRDATPETHFCCTINAFFPTLRRLRYRTSHICPRLLDLPGNDLLSDLEEVIINLSLSRLDGPDTSYRYPSRCEKIPGDNFLNLKADMEAHARGLAARMSKPRIVRVLSHTFPGLDVHSFDALVGHRMVLEPAAAWDADGEVMQDQTVASDPSDFDSDADFDFESESGEPAWIDVSEET
ncbi:hypothetical protein AK830_g5177 [Neonectria ditissima]|uniref:FAD/NAD(P)-binding domain-containing protein n=1 Tax=Neonectria ditissima TaxID=78410 RepID=A0A0P7BLN0_9HYPO|nr:hypothetical protein AK830_g5177 [Neonectria ditissima]